MHIAFRTAATVPTLAPVAFATARTEAPASSSVLLQRRTANSGVKAVAWPESKGALVDDLKATLDRVADGDGAGAPAVPHTPERSVTRVPIA